MSLKFRFSINCDLAVDDKDIRGIGSSSSSIGGGERHQR